MLDSLEFEGVYILYRCEWLLDFYGINNIIRKQSCKIVTGFCLVVWKQ